MVGELQGGVGTAAAIKQGRPADYFISSEPTDLQATTLLACAFTYVAVVILRTAPPYVGQAER